MMARKIRNRVQAIAFATLATGVGAAATQDASHPTRAQQKWIAAVDGRAARRPQYVKTLQQNGLDTSADALTRHLRCSRLLDAAFERAALAGYEAVGDQERFHVVVSPTDGDAFDLAYAYRAGNLLGVSVWQLPRGWRIVLLKVPAVIARHHQSATTVNVYGDTATACAFQFDPDDPAEAFATAAH